MRITTPTPLGFGHLLVENADTGEINKTVCIPRNIKNNPSPRKKGLYGRTLNDDAKHGYIFEEGQQDKSKTFIPTFNNAEDRDAKAWLQAINPNWDITHIPHRK